MRAETMLAAMLVAAFHVLPAQSATVPAELQELQPGVRIRLEAPGVMSNRRVATVVARAADTVTVGGDFPAMHVPIAALTSLEVSRGRSRTRGMMRGLRWGVPIGALIGVALASGVGDHCSNCESKGAMAAGAVAFGILGGMVYGVGVGALVPVERWDRYDLSARGAAVTPAAPR